MALFPDIEVSSLTNSGLLWLFLTFGYTLFQSSNLISEGSDLLLLVPAYAGIVGSCVLPVLGAVPDAAIMLFSGLGKLEEAQTQLAVGVGALSGSTIMLLTIPWAIATVGGRVDVVDGVANYRGRPKLTPKPTNLRSLSTQGTGPGPQVRTGAKAMLLTAGSYVIIQYPCVVLERRGETSDALLARGEKWFALVGLVSCAVGFLGYLAFQVYTSGTEADLKRFRADELIKRKLKGGTITLAGAMAEMVAREMHSKDPAGYAAISFSEDERERNKVRARLENIVRPFFKSLDQDNSGSIDEKEAGALLLALGENVTPGRVRDLFVELDANESGGIDFDEFVQGLEKYLRTTHRAGGGLGGDDAQDVQDDDQRVVVDSDDDDAKKQQQRSSSSSFGGTAAAAGEDSAAADEEEEDEIPQDISHLSPAQQQRVIKRRALIKLTLGTVLVLVFSDPMVDVLSEIGARTGVPPFYVSFVLAPLASNASELLAAFFYSLKKTSKAITVSYTALEGAACMNNTLALAIFMGLVFFRGIAWQYTAETISILLIEVLVALVAFKRTQTLNDAALVLAFYPLSIAVVVFLENVVGLD